MDCEATWSPASAGYVTERFERFTQSCKTEDRNAVVAPIGYIDVFAIGVDPNFRSDRLPGKVVRERGLSMKA